MKAKEVLKLLDIHRMTLYNYVKSGIISVTKLDNGTYDYDENSVFKLMKKDSRINVLYARVSTYKQKQDLNNQINRLKTFCKESNISYDKIYSEISSGIDLDRTQLSNLIDDVIKLKIKNIYVTHKDRLTRLSFKTLSNLFSKFNTNIIVIDENSNKSNDNEIFDELISLLHIFSTTMYSHRRKKKVDIMKDDIENYISTDNNS